MKVYIVDNNDGVVLAVLRKKDAAKRLVTNTGKKKWNESWNINEMNLDEIETWISQGSDGYRQKKKRA